MLGYLLLVLIAFWSVEAVWLLGVVYVLGADEFDNSMVDYYRKMVDSNNKISVPFPVDFWIDMWLYDPRPGVQLFGYLMMQFYLKGYL